LNDGDSHLTLLIDHVKGSLRNPSARSGSHNICEKGGNEMKRLLFLALALMAIAAPLASVAHADYSTDRSVRAP